MALSPGRGHKMAGVTFDPSGSLEDQISGESAFGLKGKITSDLT